VRMLERHVPRDDHEGFLHLKITTRLHDLRQTCVTLLLDLGVPPYVVREIVGYADIDMTMTIYAHAGCEAQGRSSD
jgi:integrase